VTRPEPAADLSFRSSNLPPVRWASRTR